MLLERSQSTFMKTVLIIEDNQDIRENTIEILEMANFKVLIAENGRDGLEIAFNDAPDVIICDIMMPQMDGYDVLQQLKGHSSTENIPFIYLTARTEKAEIERAMAMGADAYICKPFEINELLDEVNRFFD
ncbi:Response Regulator Receiver Signal Transduction Histidine Kinase [Fulvivirga imtechensis AK7]|uniref:Response Regulator Receiver Signal Transduction Histidine Kinase n=2 Tax=Fulvivirga TaxID=396811 RepID=L8JWB6_9BACT|nr:Response Regulator Receiver Signal Transduction Histidine Kinase [Fulvivirga imtechensis AK7]